MTTRFLSAAVILSGLLAASSSTRANEKLKLQVSPNVSSAPGTVVVKAIVEKDADNRWLRIEADSDAFFRSSDIELDGDKAPLVTELRLSNLPSGDYTVMAVLRNSSGQETIVRRSAIVLARFGERP